MAGPRACGRSGLVKVIEKRTVLDPIGDHANALRGVLPAHGHVIRICKLTGLRNRIENVNRSVLRLSVHVKRAMLGNKGIGGSLGALRLRGRDMKEGICDKELE